MTQSGLSGRSCQQPLTGHSGRITVQNFLLIEITLRQTSRPNTTTLVVNTFPCAPPQLSVSACIDDALSPSVMQVFGIDFTGQFHAGGAKMAAYVIYHQTHVSDPEAFRQKYLGPARDSVIKFGGRLLAGVSDNFEVLEGT